MDEEKFIWIVIIENEVFQDILGAYSSEEKAENAVTQFLLENAISGSIQITSHIGKLELDRENG